MSVDFLLVVTDMSAKALKKLVSLSAEKAGNPLRLQAAEKVREKEELALVLDPYQESGQRPFVFYAFHSPSLEKEVVSICQKRAWPYFDLVEAIAAGLDLLPPEGEGEDGKKEGGSEGRQATEEKLESHKNEAEERKPEDYQLAPLLFAEKFDDGKDPKAILHADLVIIGPSRTTKTPLSLLLASQGYRVVNIPIYPEAAVPGELFKIPSDRIYGLSCDPETLVMTRKERLQQLGLPLNSTYASKNRVLEELEYSQRIMQKIGCPIIDISQRAVEETAGIILRLEEDRQ